MACGRSWSVTASNPGIASDAGHGWKQAAEAGRSRSYAAPYHSGGKRNFLNINPKKTSLIFGERTVSLWGAESMQESLSDLQFSLSPRAFFQLNPQQTVKLYESVRAAAGLTGKETVIDAYCGTGTIGLWLAPYARRCAGSRRSLKPSRTPKQMRSGMDGLTPASTSAKPKSCSRAGSRRA